MDRLEIATASREIRPRDLWLLFALALVPRMVGLLWGSIDGDENFGRAARILAGKVFPEAGYYPPLKDYLNAAAYGVMFVIGRLLGIWGGLRAFREQYFRDPMPFVFAARTTTVLVGAAIAPLAALAGRRVGLDRRGSLLVGLLLALYPFHILVGHTNRTYDIGLCSALVLVVWAAARVLEEPGNLRANVWLGLATGLAVSFKQSGIFVLVPLYAALVVVLVRRISPAALLKSLAQIALATVLIWLPLNLATLIDLREYLKNQDALRQMWTSSSLTLDTVWHQIAPGVGHWLTGAGWPVVVLGLLAPLWVRSPLLLCVWFAGWAGIVLAALVSGSFQGRLYMPMLTMVYFVAGAGTIRLLQRRGWPRIVGAVGIVLLLAWAVAGTGEVIRQALGAPQQIRVDRLITELAQPETTKILIANTTLTTLPISRAAVIDARERNERLARKYKVDLGTWAEERVQPPPGHAYFITKFPWAIGGLERYDEKDVKTVQPFAWPIQKEEWDLTYWTDRGYTLFIVANESLYLNCGIPAYERMHKQIRDQCQLLRVLPTSRSLFNEGELKVYRYHPDSAGAGPARSQADGSPGS